MRPKYELGEVVIVISPTFPEYNGEGTVRGVSDERHLGKGWIYSVDPLPADTLCYETSLRKKHTPGELTFDNLMASLSSPKLITHQT